MKYSEKIFPLTLTRANKKILEKAQDCVCLYCGMEFNVKKIKQWLKLEKIPSALCRYCGLKEVIPKTYEGITITKEELNYLRNSYYGD